MFKIVHISDIHLPLYNIKPKISQLFSKRIFGYLNWVLIRKKKLNTYDINKLINIINNQYFDHIIITGDIVNIALPEEIQVANKYLKLLNNKNNISIVPGNHEAYVKKSLNKILNEWSIYMKDDFNHLIINNNKNQFPYLKIKNNIAIIGLSTACSSLPGLAIGKIGIKQINKLIKILKFLSKYSIFKILIMHHPPYNNKSYWNKRLIDSSTLLDIIKCYEIHLILHGHMHNNSIETIQSLYNKVFVLGAPATFLLKNNLSFIKYNILMLNKYNKYYTCKVQNITNIYKNNQFYDKLITENNLQINYKY